MLNRSDKYKYKIVSYKSDIPKPKKNEVVIIPADNRLMEIPPILNNEKLPNWWSKLPVGKMSLRRCQGTFDYLSLGITIPMWADVTIRPNINKTGFDFKIDGFGDKEQPFHVEPFRAESAIGCPFAEDRTIKNSDYPKLVSPWRIFTPKGISLMSLPVLHSPNPNYIVMPGLIHTDFYNQVHVVIAVLTDKEFVIPAGTPMQHMIPIRRRDNFKRIVWGNESMFKFHLGNGLGEGCLQTPDNSQLYRRKQKEIDLSFEEKDNKKWYSLKKS